MLNRNWSDPESYDSKRDFGFIIIRKASAPSLIQFWNGERFVKNFSEAKEYHLFADVLGAIWNIPDEHIVEHGARCLNKRLCKSMLAYLEATGKTTWEEIKIPDWDKIELDAWGEYIPGE